MPGVALPSCMAPRLCEGLWQQLFLWDSGRGPPALNAGNLRLPILEPGDPRRRGHRAIEHLLCVSTGLVLPSHYVVSSREQPHERRFSEVEILFWSF